MSPLLLALAIAGLGSLFATGLHGQVLSRLTAGQTVRITRQNGFHRTGVFRAITNDSLMFEIENGLAPITYALADVSKIEKKTGTYISVRTILTTVGVMTLTVGVVTFFALGFCDDLFCAENPAQAFAYGALGGTALGLPLGLILTPIIRYNR